MTSSGAYASVGPSAVGNFTGSGASGIVGRGFGAGARAAGISRCDVFAADRSIGFSSGQPASSSTTAITIRNGRVIHPTVTHPQRSRPHQAIESISRNCVGETTRKILRVFCLVVPVATNARVGFSEQMRSVEGAPQPLRPLVVVKGTIADRPWGATLAALGLSGRSGQLDLVGGDQRYQIAFVHGLVVGATSPLPVDSVARIALSNRLITPLQAKTYSKIDDVDRFADAVKLTAPQTLHLKRRVLIQRVARTFSVDVGEYTVDERLTIPALLGVEVDIRAAIYLGMRMNLSQQRLTRTMHKVGHSRFVLEPTAINDLAKFELGDEEQVVIDRLHDGTSLAELEANHRELDPRMIEALLCTLAMCNAVTQHDLPSAPLAIGTTPPPPTVIPSGLAKLGQNTMPRTPTPREPIVTRTPTQRDPSITGRTPTPREPTITPPFGVGEAAEVSAVPMLIQQDPDVTRPASTPRTLTQQAMASSSTASRTRTKRDNRTVPVATRELAELIAKSSPNRVTRDKLSRAPRERQMTDPFLEVQATKMRPPALDIDEIRELIEVGTILLERSVDHFSYLGLSFDAPIEEVRDAYLEFARYLRPEKLVELGFVGQEAEDANAVFAQVVIAYTVLTDPHRRREYVAMLEATRARARR